MALASTGRQARHPKGLGVKEGASPVRIGSSESIDLARLANWWLPSSRGPFWNWDSVRIWGLQTDTTLSKAIVLLRSTGRVAEGLPSIAMNLQSRSGHPSVPP